MSKTVDDLMDAFKTGFRQRMQDPGIRPEGDIAIRAGIRAVVEALRDEILRDYGGNNHSWCERVALGAINEILAPREGGNGAAGGSTSNASKAIGEGGASVPGTPTPAAPAPTVGQRLIKAAHEAAAIARGDDDLVVSPTGLGLSPAAPAPVCVWGRGRDVSGNTVWGLPSCGPWTYAGVDYETCPNCKKPISFKTEAQR